MMTRDTTGTRAGKSVSDSSWSSQWWWLLPPVAALLYPYAVNALYESGRLLHQATGANYAAAWLAIAVSVVLTYGVAALSIGVAYLSGRHGEFEPGRMGCLRARGRGGADDHGRTNERARRRMTTPSCPAEAGASTGRRRT